MTSRLIETLEQRQLLAMDPMLAQPLEAESDNAPIAEAGAAVGPAIELRNNGTLINSEDWVEAGNVREVTITLKNTGSAALTLNAPTFTDSNFQLTDALPAQLAAGASTSFKVQLSASTFGTYSTFVTLASNAEGNNQFTFRVRMSYVPGTGTASVAGYVFADTDGDGKRDKNEKGFAGRKVFADLDGDGQLSVLEPSATSDAKGNYRINNVPPGTTRVRQLLAKRWRVSAPFSAFQTVTFKNGNIAKANFGQSQRAAVFGIAFRDVNGDNVFGTGDVGLANVRIFLDLDKDGVIDKNEQSVRSSSVGTFFFRTLPTGKYALKVQAKPGFKAVKPVNLNLGKAEVKTGLMIGLKPAAK